MRNIVQLIAFRYCTFVRSCDVRALFPQCAHGLLEGGLASRFGSWWCCFVMLIVVALVPGSYACERTLAFDTFWRSGFLDTIVLHFTHACDIKCAPVVPS